MANRSGVRSTVSEYLVRNPGRALHVKEIMEETGLSRTQVQQSINTMIRSGVKIRIEIPGNAWIYQGPAEGTAESNGKWTPPMKSKIAFPAPDDFIRIPADVEELSARLEEEPKAVMYKEIGRNKSGDPIIQGPDGVLWIAREIV